MDFDKLELLSFFAAQKIVAHNKSDTKVIIISSFLPSFSANH